jgi:hypothetical protein
VLALGRPGVTPPVQLGARPPSVAPPVGPPQIASLARAPAPVGHLPQEPPPDHP